MTNVIRTFGHLGAGSFHAAFANPDVMSQIGVLLTKAPHRGLDDALDAYVSGTGPAADVADALDNFSTHDCDWSASYRAPHTAPRTAPPVLSANPDDILAKAKELAGRFRAERMTNPII